MIMKQVKDWMNSHVITVSGSSTLPDAYWLMLENNVRRLPVVEDGVLVGIVTLEDLRRMDPIEAARFDIIRISNMLARLPVRQLMTKNPKTIAPAESLVKAAQLMLRKNKNWNRYL
jgi:acetoin utilization protein AcuB